MRKAIEALAADNLVVRRQGKGTFVATHTEEQASMFRFLRIRRNDGEDEYPGSRLIDVRRAKASAEVARLLELKSGDGVIVLRRVLEYSGAPVVLDEITLPGGAVQGADQGTIPGLSRVDVRLLRDAVRRAHACAPRKSCARSPPIRRARGCSALRPRTPLLAVDRITFTYGDRPVEWRRGLCVTRGTTISTG